MLKSMIITIFIIIIAVEFLEHIAFPIVWSILNGRKRSICGVEGMIGKTVEIRRWNKTKGKVLFKGELWNAECEVPLPVGSKAVVREIEKLTLKLSPPDNPDDTKLRSGTDSCNNSQHAGIADLNCTCSKRYAKA